PEPDHGPLRRGADRQGGHACVRARRRRGRARRMRAVPGRQRGSRPRPGLHRRFLHGGRARWRRPDRRRGVRRPRPGDPQQAARGHGRRGHREDRAPRADHRLHPEATPGHLRPQGPQRGGLMSSVATGSSIPSGGSLPSGRPVPGPSGSASRLAAGLAIAIAAVLAVLLANLWVPADHPLHLSDYAVSLTVKILCYSIVSLAMDLVWGYAGILSLGHGLFFALGGYAMGMYLMRSIGREGVYQSDLPDFMVFLDWKELPWHWAFTEHFAWALLLVVAVPGIVA